MRTWVSGMAACGFHSVWKKLSAQRPEHHHPGPSRTVPVSPSAKRAKRYAPGNRCAVIVRASPGARTQTAIARASGSIIKRLIYPSTIRAAHNSL